jgi:hypothetical protein
MAEEPLSEHCSLMSRPGDPAKPAERPADCPKDAVYIKGSGGTILPGNAPFPFVFEGGDGDDKVVVVGQAQGGLLFRGGKGSDTLTLEDRWTWFAREIGPPGLIMIIVIALTLAALVTISWRALRTKE